MAGKKGRSGNKPLPEGKAKILKAFRLKPHLAKFVEQEAGKGEYKDETAVVEAGLALLMQLK